MPPEARPPVEPSLAERAFNLQQGPELERLRALEAEEAMKAIIALQGLSRQLRTTGDQTGAELLTAAWGKIFPPLTGELTSQLGYSHMEVSVMMMADGEAARTE